MESKDHEIQEHIEFYTKPDIAYVSTNIDFPIFFPLSLWMCVCLQDDLWGRLSLIHQQLFLFLLPQCLWNLWRITRAVFYQLISSSSKPERGICFQSSDAGTSIHEYNPYIHPYISTLCLCKISFFSMSPIAWEILQCSSQLKRELFSKYSLETLRVQGIKHKSHFYMACASKISLSSLFWQSAFSVLPIPEAGKQHIFVTKSSTKLNNHLEMPNIFSPSHLFTGIIVIYKQDQSNSLKRVNGWKNSGGFRTPVITICSFSHHTANFIGQYLGEVQVGEDEYWIKFVLFVFIRARLWIRYVLYLTVFKQRSL